MEKLSGKPVTPPIFLLNGEVIWQASDSSLSKELHGLGITYNWRSASKMFTILSLPPYLILTNYLFNLDQFCLWSIRCSICRVWALLLLLGFKWIAVDSCLRLSTWYIAFVLGMSPTNSATRLGKSLWGQFFYKSSQKIGDFLGYFKVKTAMATFGKNWNTF